MNRTYHCQWDSRDGSHKLERREEEANYLKKQLLLQALTMRGTSSVRRRTRTTTCAGNVGNGTFPQPEAWEGISTREQTCIYHPRKCYWHIPLGQRYHPLISVKPRE